MSTPDSVPLVRREIRRILEQSPAYQALSVPDRSTFAKDLVTVGAYLSADPGWLDAEDPPGTAEALATPKASPVEQLKGRLAQAPGQVGKDFQAGAMRQGVEEFGNLVQTVDFPEFVSGLVQGVFQAIVDASIQQMQAYADLMAATAKSVGEFANDHIPEQQAREQLQQRFPSLLKLDRDDDGVRRLVLNEEAEDTTALQQMVRQPVDLSSSEGEQKFVQSARTELARQRQKMMAMMVMLGINRIVVTNGRINAKVVFDIRASDEAKRKARASLDDKSEDESGAVMTAALPWGAAGGYNKSRHTATVRSSIDDSSQSKAEMKAQLSGDVRINFKSETLPPEKMLDALQMEQFGSMASPGRAAPPPAAAAPPAATAPAQPVPIPAGGAR